jgi:hypothetical protein
MISEREEYEFQAELEANGLPANPVQTWREPCAKCNGRGYVRIGYHARQGTCFACKGAGHFERRTSPQARAQVAARKVAKKEANAQSWAQAHPEAASWIAAKAPRFGFAQAMAEAVEKYGHLTEKQLATVERLRAQDVARQAQWAAEKAQQEASAPAIEIGRIEAAFEAAIAKGLKKPVLRLAGFRFSLAPEGRNAGAIYVKDAASRDYLGKVQGGKFQRRFGSCDDATAAQVVELAADPEAAAIAYGRKFGQCAACARELSNGESIERGIGPICAQKFGWG